MQNKVPKVTLATTLGETFGDFLSMTLGLGYAASTALLFVVFVITTCDAALKLDAQFEF